MCSFYHVLIRHWAAGNQHFGADSSAVGRSTRVKLIDKVAGVSEIKISCGRKQHSSLGFVFGGEISSSKVPDEVGLSLKSGTSFSPKVTRYST